MFNVNPGIPAKTGEAEAINYIWAFFNYFPN
jgi:hypothetical protein